jgi:exopolysaccharide biosynthesis predicted pyruvyltransferase EpsI
MKRIYSTYFGRVVLGFIGAMVTMVMCLVIGDIFGWEIRFFAGWMSAVAFMDIMKHYEDKLKEESEKKDTDF